MSATRRLRQATLSLWFEGSDPLTDPADETVGVMQVGEHIDDPRAATAAFAGAVLDRHFDGECGCQQ